MKIFHTSDWHLGHRLYERERTQEQQLALNWLIAQLRAQQAEVLIVSGDIFDQGNPPNSAREQYYNFLAELKHTYCRHVVIIGGNHDSPSMLNAPSAFFRHFNIHVVGAAASDPADQLIVLKDAKGQPECVVAAVPFLRDRDLHYSQAGEQVAEREQRLQAGIRAHYTQLAELAQPFANQGIPIIATGHLYAHGATTNEKKSNIYVGNQKNIAGTDFPAVFDYVALGHIHRPQKVAKLDHVRYSGSLIPLDFSELGDTKLVLSLDFIEAKDQQKSQVHLTELQVPTFRRLKQLSGSLEEVTTQLTKFLAKRSTATAASLEPLTPWLEVRVISEQPILQLREQLEEIIGEQPAKILAVKLERTLQQRTELDLPQPDLSELDVEDVFQRRCQGEAEEIPADYAALLDSFRALRSWKEERETA